MPGGAAEGLRLRGSRGSSRRTAQEASVGKGRHCQPHWVSQGFPPGCREGVLGTELGLDIMRQQLLRMVREFSK